MLDAEESCPGAKFEVSQTNDSAVLTTDASESRAFTQMGRRAVQHHKRRRPLRERNSIPRTYEPVELNGEKTFHIEDRFAPDFSEGYYGLGQHQSGLFNYRGATVELGQNNTDVAIPLLLSTKGYALMWNSASLTHVDNRFPLELNVHSLAGHAIDYYFIYGPEMDQIIHQYRNLDRTLAVTSQVGLWILSIEGSIRLAGRGTRNRATIPQGTNAARWDCAGLVLVEVRGRSDFH